MRTLHLSIIIGIGMTMLIIGNFNLSFAQDNEIDFGGSKTFIIVDTPLKQFKSGISASNVTCHYNFQLVVKAEDSSPACVKADDATKLVARGWAQQAFYYNTQWKPKIILNDYFYDGIDKDNTTVSINNQTYYQTTLGYLDWNLKKNTSIQFQNVIFSFPQGTMATPGGAFVMLEMKFQDRSIETYGENKINPDGSGAMGGIPIPTPYGPHSATNSTTVLSNHVVPQAGMTIYNDKIKLLVSTDANSPNIKTQISDSSNALQLHLSTTSQMIKPGQAIGITISVNNTSSHPIQMPAQNNWSYGNVATGLCARIGYGIAILDGYYTSDNLTQGKILPIFNLGALCPVIIEHATMYEFQPSSGQVKEIQCDQTQDIKCNPNSYQMGENYRLGGYWNYGSIEPFKSGIYTIVGADEWGHVAIEHLVVTNSTIFAGELGSINCPMMYGGVQISATIKNSTGFANYYNSTQYGNTFFLHPGMQGKINVQYNAPANAAWFQNNGNASLNMTNGAALYYMANVTNGKTITSYAVSSYDDETGHHTRICHYFLPNGGFAEPCNTDNTGDIPPGEIPGASSVQHAGISTLFEPNSVMIYPNSNPVFTSTVSANSNAMPGIYWLSLERSLCGPGVLAKLVVLP
jgi:hypothetical protein